MALIQVLVCAAALFAPVGCKDWQRPSAKVQQAVLQGDTTSHVLGPDDRDLVLRARALDRADNRDSARALYEEAARKLPAISDWLYLRAAGIVADSSARGAYFAKIRSAVARDRIRVTDALARERSGDISGAIRAYSAAGAPLSALRLRISPGISDSDKGAARADLLSHIRNQSGSDDTRDAIALFDQIFPQRAPQEELALARAASGAGWSARAAAGYSRALKANLGTSADVLRYGSALARLNRDTDAATQFARVRDPSPLAAAAAYQRARALIALGKVPRARSILQSLVSSFPRDTSAASALLLLSDLATDEGRDDAARSTLLGLVRRFPASRQAAVALFRAATIAFIGRDYRSAAAEMDSLARRHPESAEAQGAGYWAGKAFAALGDTLHARERWRSVIVKEPMNYYAVMSAKKLDTVVIAPDRSSVSYLSVPAVDSALARVATLMDVGMDTEAEFENLRLFREATISPDRLVATANAFAGTDQSERSIALGKKALDEIGRLPANYRLYFPVVEREILIQSAKENGLDPALVASLIRQESLFNPRATSAAGARGLMQLMPSVGRTVAASKGIGPWDPALLYQPAINIRLGTAHLSGLARKYPDIVKVLAAYNAGELRVAKWSTKRGGDDPEIFTERIPFVETRDYVRIILRNRAFYEALYPW